MNPETEPADVTEPNDGSEAPTAALPTIQPDPTVPNPVVREPVPEQPTALQPQHGEPVAQQPQQTQPIPTVQTTPIQRTQPVQQTQQTQPVPSTTQPPTQPQQQQPAPLIKPAKPVRRPLGTLPALIPGTALSIAAIGIGAVGIHDALVLWTRSDNWSPIDVTGHTWIGAAIHYVKGLTPQLWMSVAGIGLALLGIWLVVVALKPRRVRGVALTSDAGIWLEDTGIARLANGAAKQVQGVRSARSTVGRRSVSVVVDTGPGDSQALAAQVRDAVATHLQPLARAPKITVSVRQPDATPKAGNA